MLRRVHRPCLLSCEVVANGLDNCERALGHTSTSCGYLTIVGRTGVRPDSVQVLDGMLSWRLPTSVTGVALYRFALRPGAVAGAWLQRGLPCSQ